jgi:hypothetical protein
MRLSIWNSTKCIEYEWISESCLRIERISEMPKSIITLVSIWCQKCASWFTFCSQWIPLRFSSFLSIAIFWVGVFSLVTRLYFQYNLNVLNVFLFLHFCVHYSKSSKFYYTIRVSVFLIKSVYMCLSSICFWVSNNINFHFFRFHILVAVNDGIRQQSCVR